MAQFTVYQNANPETVTEYPLLVDLQSDLVGELATRVVAPLCRTSQVDGIALQTLNPVFEIKHERYILITQELAGVMASQLGAEMATLAAHREAIIAALDLLFTGI